MLTPLAAKDKLQRFFDDTNEYFYLLDFGSQHIKFGLLAVNSDNKTSQLIDVVEEFYPPRGIDQLNLPVTESMCRTGVRALHMPKHVKIKKPKLVIGLSSEMVYGDSTSYLYKREDPNEPIDMREIKNIFHKAELRAYENIRKKFNEETGFSEDQVHLIDATIQAIKLDDRKVIDPIGKTGEELQINIFNAYLPTFYKKFFEDLSQRLNMRLASMVYEPYALSDALIQHENPELDAVVLDVGGRTTSVSLLRHGRLEAIKTFSFGGESFTRRIASELKLSALSAEGVKRRYSASILSKNAQKSLNQMLRPELSMFLNALELILKEFSQINLLPGRIYVHGGGGALPLISLSMRRKNWRRNISFIGPTRAQALIGDEFKTALSPQLSFHPQLVSVMALADHTLRHYCGRYNDLSRVLRRMVNIIQA